MKPSDKPISETQTKDWELLGVSKHIRELRALIAEEAQKPLTVLIQGLTGTGKELVAKDIHSHSPRKNKPFVALNCGAIPEDLVESELFGHEAGSFTGATRKKRGLVALANGGTLFLDEVGDLRADHQVKLLKFLDSKKYRPVGSEIELEVDVKVIAATNKDLAAEVRNKTFREDFYHRLSQSIIKIPPLKDRPEDIVYLVNYFANKEKIKIEYKKKLLLYSYFYPGNVRQLINYLNRSIDQIIEEWKEELIAQGFDREIIIEFKSYEDFDNLERQAKSYYFRQRVGNGSSHPKQPSEPWAEKLLKDPDVHDCLKAIALVDESSGDFSKIVEAYEIVTLLSSGMSKSSIVEFLHVRRGKSYSEYFKENFGLSLPGNNEQHMKFISLRFSGFPLFQAKLNELQEMETNKILKSFS